MLEPLAEVDAAPSPVSTTAPAFRFTEFHDQVNDCVDFVQFGAFTGNDLFTQWWHNAGEDPVRLRLDCQAFGMGEPDTLRALSDEWRAMSIEYDIGG